MSLWELLDPQGEIAPNFLNLFAVLSIYAAWVAYRARARMRSLAADVQSSRLDVELEQAGDASDYVDSIRSVQEKRVENLPGVMLVLGLMGTFFGLALAIHDAAAALGQQASTTRDINNQIGHLAGALKAMGMKFQTSIYGISGSLLIRAIGTFWIERARENLRAVCRERIRALRVAAAASATAHREAVEGRLIALAEHSARLLRLDDLELVPARLGEQVAALAGSAVALRASLESFERVSERAGAFADAANAIATAVVRLESTASGAYDRAAQRAESDQQATRALTEAVARLERASIEASERSAKSAKTVTAATRVLNNAAARLEKHTDVAVEKTSAVAERVSAAARTTAGVATALEQATTDLSAKTSANEKTIVGAVDSLLSATARLEGVAALTRATVIELESRSIAAVELAATPSPTSPHAEPIAAAPEVAPTPLESAAHPASPLHAPRAKRNVVLP